MKKTDFSIDQELLEYTKSLIKKAEEDAKIQLELRENAFLTQINF